MGKKTDINRTVAYQVLLRIEADGTYSNLELNNQIAKQQPDAPWFVRDLVYTVLRHQKTLDFYLNQLVKKGVKSLDKKPLTLLRMGLTQILYMDGVPEYAAVNETVLLARRFCKYQSGMVNGVLRNFLRNNGSLKSPESITKPLERLSVMYSMDTSIVKLWVNQYGEERAEELLKACNTIPPLTIRVNEMRTTKEALMKRFSEDGITTAESDFGNTILQLSGRGILDREEYQEGLFTVQGVGSISAIEELNPLEGMTVVDVCAAPGGKSIACAERMHNKGRVVSMDVNPRKLQQLASQSNRLGLTIIETQEHDGTKTREDLVGVADCVICDVPCSGLGILRRKPELKSKVLFQEGKELAKKQYEILEASEKYVKPGGMLMYSTCTINSHENRDVVAQFLKNHENYRMISYRQFLPSQDGVDGFYYCKMKKKY